MSETPGPRNATAEAQSLCALVYGGGARDAGGRGEAGGAGAGGTTAGGTGAVGATAGGTAVRSGPHGAGGTGEAAGAGQEGRSLPPEPLRMQGVGLLAAGLAHDLNTMLGGILATAELMSARVPPDGDLAQDLGEIIGQAERAGALIGKLLAFSRQEHLRPTRVDLAALLGRMEPVLRALLGRHIGLSLPSRRGHTVDADPQALERVVMNLVTNARDAIGSRPGHVSIGLERVHHADLPADAQRFMPALDYAALSVSDDGPGVPVELRARIFEPYFTTKGEGAGTGLGLSTAYGLVKQSGGFLLLDDAPRRGARFTVYLPAAPAERETVAIVPVGRPLILLAEDEELLRSCARRGLEQAGYAVIAVEGGEEAEAAFGANPGVSALVSDVRMPGLDGVELARRLRARRPGLPVLLVSGYADAGARDAFGGLDVAFLAKPFRLDDLRRSVEALI